MARLVYQPNYYWPDDSYFHRRNRQKLARAWEGMSELHDLSPDSVIRRFESILEERSTAQVTTIYAMSNGSSGCHFLGQLLDRSRDHTLTDEVYFPPDLLEDASESGDPTDHRIIDFINFFHTGSVAQEAVGSVIVNIGHLRRDAPPSLLKSLDPQGRMLLLIRNPFDVAVSRAFRKLDYRKQVAPGMSDDDYLRRQVSGTCSFLSYAAQFRWDQVIRYEDLRRSPRAVVGEVIGEHEQADVDEAYEDGHSVYNLVSYGDDEHAPSASGSLNVEPPPELTSAQLEILEHGLSEIAHQYGYDLSSAQHVGNQ